MAHELSYDFEELRLVLDARDPHRAIGYFSGTLEGSFVSGGYTIDSFYITNTAELGSGFVLIADDHPLFPLFAQSIRHQFDGDIRDHIAEELAWEAA